MRHNYVLLLLIALMPLNGFGQVAPSRDLDSISTTEREEPANPNSPLRKLIDESLAWEELFTSEKSTTPMTARIVMRWANNARGSETGVTVLFVAEGRPEVVCGVYPWQNNLIHEFDSLSRGKPVGRRNGAVVWNPDKPGVQFESIRDAETPADSPAARLRQMKVLSRQFSSTMLGWRADKSDREALRLLPQPLYRYEIKRADLLDGAVFAFTQGTDPESLLIVEAIQVRDKFEWCFAFVRNTSGELEGRHNDNVVWHADRFPESNNPRSTHFSLSRAIDTSDADASKQKD